jgi:hypothetical protein
MLDQCRDAAGQPGNAEPEDDGDQDSDVKVEIDIAQQGATLSHEFPFSRIVEAAGACDIRRHVMVRDEGLRISR